MAFKNKEALKAYQRQHYLLNKAKYVSRSKCFGVIAMQRNKEFVKEFLKSHPCVDCGEADIVVLEFDHMDSSIKKEAISKLVRNRVSVEAIQREIEKCEVRCANCHRRKTAKQFNWV